MKFRAACSAALLASAAARVSKSASALRGAALMPHESLAVVEGAREGGGREVNPGTKDCPCIGFRGTSGEVSVLIDNGTKSLTYPAEIGSYCSTWDDDRHPECQGDGADAAFCGASWCFVDACHCQGLEVPPKASQFMAGAVYKGMPIYYSYSTCGSEDMWTKEHNGKACTLRQTKEECEAGEHECAWGDIGGKEQCAAWEAAGLCMDLPEQSPWGNIDCPCVGWSGVNGTLNVDGKPYPADLGSTCEAWDMEHSPQCSGDDKAEGCDQPWCFVDTEHCKIPEAPQRSSYLSGATFQGRHIHYSYETCGGKRSAGTTTTTTTTAAAAKAQEDEEDEGNDADEHDEEREAPAQEKAHAGHSGQIFDEDAYSDEWHQEWRNGRAPHVIRDKYPHIKDLEDRQSDGVPSPVS